MNNLSKAAILRWKKKLDKDLVSIPNDKKSLLKKVALCGFLAGDGSVQMRKDKKGGNYFRYQLDFFPDDEEMLKVYLLFIKEVYNLFPKVTIRDNMYDVRLSQKFIVQDITKLCKFGLYKWNFPKELFKIEGAKENWLRAFFSAEAYVGKKVIKIQSVNIKSIRQVLKMLSDLEIKGNYYEYIPKNKNHSKVGMIFINDKNSRFNYYYKIGFWHLKKNKILKQALGL